MVLELPVFLGARSPVTFPEPDKALSEPNALLAVGGNLEPDTLIAAYRTGCFPWYQPPDPILWWSPDPRAVLYPGEIHVSRTLRRVLRRGQYRITTDAALTEVISACAAARKNGPGTWLDDAMIEGYLRLANSGWVHSVECWMDDELAGGLYGVAVGGIFCGESMFSRRADASKVALVHLAKGLSVAGFRLIDCQVASEHLRTLGAVDIDREMFLAELARHRDADLVWPSVDICSMVNRDENADGK
ncbi:MAG TPA: leucyl/phenylalanyl-tRNA--protein transferase [Porticoccaceae bacterium]|nr:leucyl/phenylalanyl-tRNA--protein transferase [Porticoccaceae bacterium]